MVNPYLKKRSKGKKIVKDNPLYKKDMISSSTVVAKPQAQTQSTNMADSVSDRFSKELGQHGFLKHSNAAPKSYVPPQKTVPDRPYESQEEFQMAEPEPYKREAGKASLKPQTNSYRNSALQPSVGQFNSSEVSRQPVYNDREIGSRNMNRRIIEENLLRNASAERQQELETSKMYEQSLANNASFQHKYNDSFDSRLAAPQAPVSSIKTLQPNFPNIYNEDYPAGYLQNYNQEPDEPGTLLLPNRGQNICVSYVI